MTGYVKIPQYKSSYMKISITKATDKDIPFILGLRQTNTNRWKRESIQK